MQKAANIAGLGANLRLIPTREEGDADNEPFALDAKDLATVLHGDMAQGLTPILVSANVGSTNTCAVDPVRALGEACRR